MVGRRTSPLLLATLLVASARPEAAAELKRPRSLVAFGVAVDRIELRWADANTTESGYVVERRRGSEGPFSALATTGADVTSFTDAGLAAATRYHYRVRALAPAGFWSRHAHASASTLRPGATAPLRRPLALRAAAVSSSQIDLAWIGANPAGVVYSVERRRSHSKDAFEVVGVTAGGADTYSDTGLAPATRYRYRVRAVGPGDTWSRCSRVARARTFGDDPGANRAPVADAGADQRAPVGATVTFDGSGSVDPDGTIASFAWSFGDATSATGATTSHAFTAEGRYTVTLTVTDNLGATATDTATVAVGSTTTHPGLVGFVPGVGTAADVEADGVRGLTFVASREFGLAVVDTTHPDDPALVGSADHPFNGEKVAVAGGRAVVAGTATDGQAAFRVVDVADPTAPRVAGVLTTDTVERFGGVGIDEAGSLAVVTLGGGGLWTVDLEDPRNPRVAGSLDTAGASGVAVRGNRVYVADGVGGLLVVDLTRAAAPAPLGSATLPGLLATDIVVAGTRAYVAGSNELVVFDVSNAAAPAVMGRVALSGAAFHVAVVGATVAVVTKGPFEDFLEIVDVASPAAPVLRTTLSLGPPASAAGVSLTATHAFVGNTSDGLRAFSLTGPAGPTLRGTLVDEFRGADIAVAGSRAVVAGTDRFEGVGVLKVLDAALPAAPEVLGTLTTGAAAAFHGVALDASGTLAVATLGAGGVWTVDLSDPRHPTQAGSLDTTGDARGVVLSGTRAYVADGPGGLAVIDVANPARPTLLGSVPGLLARDVAVEGTMAYVAGLTGYLFVVDASVAGAPALVGTRRLSGAALDVAVAGTRAAVVTAAPSGDMLDVVDVASPAAPAVQATLPLGPVGSAAGVALDGTRAHVASAGDGLVTFDLSAPGAPREETTTPTVGDPLKVVVDGSLAWVADFPATVSIVDPAP
jgi:hypothetical protein